MPDLKSIGQSIAKDIQQVQLTLAHHKLNYPIETFQLHSVKSPEFVGRVVLIRIECAGLPY